MIDIRFGEARPVTRSAGIETRHSFSFGAHYDPANTGFGRLLACNEEHLAPGAGYGPHEHRDLEVVTWVLEGELAHEDDQGHRSVVRKGQLQVMRAGDGIVHSESNASATEPLRFVQMWLTSEEPQLPSYQVLGVEVLRLPGAVLHVMQVDGEAALPTAALVHAMVTSGSVVLDGIGPLEAGDAVRLRDEGQISLRGRGELLVWELASPRG